MAGVIDMLKAVGKPAALRAEAQRLGRAAPLGQNAHIHLPPNFSAFESVSQAVGLAAGQGVRVLGASNYYDYRVYAALADEGRRNHVFPLFGIEIICMIDELRQVAVKLNDPGNPGKMYVCGKGITRFEGSGDGGQGPENDAGRLTARGAVLLGRIRDGDAARMRLMAEKMAAVFAAGGVHTGLNTAGLVDMVVTRHACPAATVYLQERHLAQGFQEALFAKVPAGGRVAALEKIVGTKIKAKGEDDAVGIQNELRSHLMKAGKPAFAEERFVTFDEARDLILELGGIPAYPVVADGAAPMGGFEEPAAKLIENLKARGIFAAEFIPARNSLPILAEYVKSTRAAGLVVTAGTEHNSLDLIPLEPRCKGGVEITPDLKALFWEGACVVAAHQYLTAHGEIGYVDRAGTVQRRIEETAQLGALVIKKYLENCGA